MSNIKNNRCKLVILLMLMFFVNAYTSLTIGGELETGEDLGPETVIETGTEETSTENIVVDNKVEDENYIYFDLYYGNVTISGTNYSGYVLVDGVSTSRSGVIGNKAIYVYQSNGENTEWVDGLPYYSRVSSADGKTWANYITNNTSVDGVVGEWINQAPLVGRTATSYKIHVSGAG